MDRCHPIVLGLALLAGACRGAAPNPAPATVPSAWQPPPKSETAAGAAPAAATAAATTAAQTPAKSADKSGQAGAATPADEKAPAKDGSAKPRDETGEPIVAMVAGKPVYVTELLTQWLYSDSIQVLENLDNLAIGRLVLAEAGRLGVRIDPDRVEEAYEKAVKTLETEIGRKRQGMTLDRYVDRVLGLDPIRYRERLRQDTLRSQLTERVMRAWLIANEHAFVHVIVVGSEEDVKAVQDDLAAAKPFEDVARSRSVDTSSKDGGRVAPIVKGDTPMGKLAFETKEGGVAGPMSDGGGKWLFMHVDKRPAPITGDWSKIAVEVEKSLAEQPIDGLEMSQWKRAMTERYVVDLKPFLRLVGQTDR